MKSALLMVASTTTMLLMLGLLSVVPERFYVGCGAIFVMNLWATVIHVVDTYKSIMADPNQ